MSGGVMNTMAQAMCGLHSPHNRYILRNRYNRPHFQPARRFAAEVEE